MSDKKTKLHHKIFSVGREIALGSAILLIISAFLYWGHTPNESIRGIEGDGKITIILGLLAFIFLFIRRISLWISLALGILALAIGSIVLIQVLDVVREVPGNKVGAGLYMGILASFGIVLGTIGDLLVKRKDKLFYLDESEE